jgi:hypothetical protein
MLNKAKLLKGYKLDSLEGEIGKVKEFYFDDKHWTVRYLVADTGSWLSGRQVLISPYALVAVNKEKQHITINLTKKQIENSPSLDSDSLYLSNLNKPIIATTVIRHIGAVHICGVLILILNVIWKNGKNSTKAGKRGIPICAAHMK